MVTNKEWCLTEGILETDTDPAWSPDGTQLVFSSGRQNGGLFITSLHGESVRKIVDFGFSPSWSPSGEQIVFISQKDMKDNEIYLVKPSGEDLKVVQENDLHNSFLTVSWSPSGDWLFYQKGKGSKSSIWAYSLLKKRKIEFLKGDFYCTHPLMANNMKDLYFRSNQGGSSEIWKITLNIEPGQIKIIEEAKQITTGAGVLRYSITPDASKIVYSKSEKLLSSRVPVIGGSITNLYFMDINQVQSTNIVQKKRFPIGIRSTSDPEFSLNGKWIAVESDQTGKHEIWLISHDGETTRMITDDEFTNTGPSWSPDGQKLVYDSGGGNSAEIKIISVDGNNQMQLTNNDYADWLPDWSPDGEKIIFTSNRSGNWDIWQISITGNELKQLTDHPLYDFCPKWSPNGEKIAFISSRTGFKNVWILSVNDSSFQQVTHFKEEGVGRTCSWGPLGDKIYFCKKLNDVFNVFSINIKTGKYNRLTNFNEINLKASDWGGLTVFNNKLVFSVTINYGGDIWIMEAQD